MFDNKLLYTLSLSLSVAALSACTSSDEPNPEPIGTMVQGLPKASGGTNGDADYCISGAPCLAEEGDCDYDGHCVAGTYCADNIGPAFGFSSSTDVCVDDTCLDGFLNGNETEVDCGPGCVPCTSPAGGPNYCTTASPCQAEEGDCDYDGHCVPGTVCASNIGASFGFTQTTDVCVDDTCFDGILNGNETQTDCGPGCVPCTGTPLSASTLGSTGDELAGKIVTDNSGEKIIAGSFRNTTNLGGGVIEAFGTTNRRDVFVTKRRADNSHIWTRRFGGAVSDGDGAVSVAEGAGLIVVVGNFHETADFGGGLPGFVLTSNGWSDIFVVAMDTNGVVQWARSFGGTGYDIAHDVEVDAGGNVQVVGSFENTVTFGSDTYTSFGRSDGFVIRLGGSTGDVVRSARFGGVSVDAVYSADSAPDRSLTIGGTFSATTTFDSTQVVSAGFRDAFVARLNPYTLRVQWLNAFGGAREDSVGSVSVDSSSQVYATGRFMRAVDFGGGTRTATSVDSFTVALDSSGGYRWDAVLGDSASVAVEVDLDTGNVGIAGWVNGDNPQLSGAGAGGRDAFTMLFDNNGNVIEAFQDGGVNDDEGAGITLYNGIMTAVGDFTGTGNFAGQDLTSAGQRDVFLYGRSY